MRNLLFFTLLLFTLLAKPQTVKQQEIYFDSDSTQLQEVIHFLLKDSTLHGSYEAFYTNGSLKIHGFYKNNLPNGIWTYYFENGKKKSEGNFVNGKTNGHWIFYYENGNKKSEGILHNDIKEKEWVYYFENGEIKRQGKYKNNQKIGEWNYYYENQILKAQTIYKNNSGYYVEFYPSGRVKMEGKNQNEISMGEWKYYYNSGELQAKGNFIEGLRTGEWKYFYKNGNISTLGYYEKGKEVGIWKQYHDDGNLKTEGAMEWGEKDGFWKMYYPTGEVKGEIEYRNHQGFYKEYYPSGKLRVEGETINDKKEGLWTYYSEQGIKDGEANYEKGIGIYKGYYPNGKVKMEGEMQDDKRVGEWLLYNKSGKVVGTYKPIYESEDAIIKGRKSLSYNKPVGSIKPEYLYENKKNRYFTPSVNEFKGIIVATNPLLLFLNTLPISFEYYLQERLGYELQFNISRDPFFVTDKNIDVNVNFERTYSFHFKQKFYHQDGKFGMWYFGHQLEYGYGIHSVNSYNPLLEKVKNNMAENKVSYGLLLGNRWLQNITHSSFTIDVFIGVGYGLRFYTKQYSENENLDAIFEKTLKKRGFIPIIFGLNFGILKSIRK